MAKYGTLYLRSSAGSIHRPDAQCIQIHTGHRGLTSGFLPLLMADIRVWCVGLGEQRARGGREGGSVTDITDQDVLVVITCYLKFWNHLNGES